MQTELHDPTKAGAAKCSDSQRPKPPNLNGKVACVQLVDLEDPQVELHLLRNYLSVCKVTHLLGCVPSSSWDHFSSVLTLDCKNALIGYCVVDFLIELQLFHKTEQTEKAHKIVEILK